jgi:transcriptional regulator with XRE-family HTH domain
MRGFCLRVKELYYSQRLIDQTFSLYLFDRPGIMKAKTVLLLPTARKILEQVGEDIKLARLRRRLSAEQVAERAGISRSTLWLIEKGTSSVAMGAYLQVLFVLGLEKNLLKAANDDVLGRKLQDIGLLVKQRAPKRKKTSELSTDQKP